MRPNTTLDVDAESGLLANDSDPDGDPMRVVLTSVVLKMAHLSVFTDGSFTYTPNEDFTGVEQITYTNSDGVEETTATLAIEVVNQPPVANDDSYSMRPNTTLDVDAEAGLLVNDSDPDGDPIRAILIGNAQNGTLNVNTAGAITYTPEEDFVGVEQVQYTISDGLETATANLIINVESGTNAPPVAENDSYTTEFNTQIAVDAAQGVLANDSDPDGDVLDVISFEEAENGTLSIEQSGAFTYQPFDGFIGEESVEYTVSDGSLTAVGMLIIDVEDTPPIAGNSCEMYDPQPLSRGFGGVWMQQEDEQSASFYVPASQRGGGIIRATLSAGNAEITPDLRVCINSNCTGGSIVTHTAIEENAATVEFQAAGGQSYHFDILQFGNAPEEDYPVGYSLSVNFSDRIDCWEKNNNVDVAKQINIGEAVKAYMIEGFRDNALRSGEYADWYTFQLDEEAFIEINMPQPPGLHLMRVKLFDEPSEEVADVLLEGQQEEKGEPFIATSTRAKAPGTYYLRVGTLLSEEGTVSGTGDQPDHWNQKYEMTVTANTVTSTEDDSPVPEAFVLSQNYPNPFNPSTTIDFALPQPETVRLQVFNSIGKSVSLLLDKPLPAGQHSVVFDASNLPSGIYIYRIEAGGFVENKKLTLIK